MHRIGRWRRVVVCALAFGMACVASTQDTRAGDVARFVEWTPHPGAKEAFAAGYKRHLQWHREHRDPWTWTGWYVASGERAGLFVDASFGHTWEALDHSVSPAADGADNANNVEPHATPTFVAHLVRLPAHSRGNEDAAARARLLTTVRWRPGTGGAEAGWQGVDAAFAGLPVQAYRMVGGAQAPYLLAIPHANWAEFGRIEAAIAAMRDGVEVERVEVLRRDAGMSYAPE